MVSHSPIASTAPKSSERAQSARLNRLIVAARDEGLALNEAARYVGGEERRRGLLTQALRRAALQRDLATDVVSLGGVPALSASFGAHWRAWRRAFTRLLVGSHQGDVYDACARATQRTSDAYSRAIGSTSKDDDVRQRLERERGEIDQDFERLRKLRWGGNVSFRDEES